MYFVYILKSRKDGSKYIGYTKDLKNRIREHNSKEGRYSKTKVPFDLVWYASFKNKTLALNFEKYLKSSSGHAFTNKRLI